MYSGVDRRATVTIPQEQLEKLLESAGEKGAEKALERLGLSLDKDGRKDIQDMIDFVGVWRVIKRTTLRTVITVFIVGLLSLTALGLFVKTGHVPQNITKGGG